MLPDDGRVAHEAPSREDVRIIGVELAVTRRNEREQELEMFACRHTIPRATAWVPMRGPSDGLASIRVTLHTSEGDLTAYLSTRGPGLVANGPIY